MGVGTESLLDQLSGHSKDTENVRIASRIPIINFRSLERATKSGTIDLSSISQSYQKSTFSNLSPKTLSNEEGESSVESQTSSLEGTNQLEDSGYESTSPKKNEYTSKNKFTGSMPNALDPRTVRLRQHSAPSAKMLLKPTRIPSSTTSTKMMKLKRSNSQNLSSTNIKSPFGSPTASKISFGLNDDRKLSVENVTEQALQFAFGDQRQPVNRDENLLSKNFTEEGFLRLTGIACKEQKEERTPFYRSLPSIENQTHTIDRIVDNGTGMVMKINFPQPRFIKQPMTGISSEPFPNIPVRLPSYFSMLKESDSFQAIKTSIDENVKEILHVGTDEFSGKYSEWIQQIFNLQLEKIHSRLKGAYTKRLNDSVKEKEHTLLEVKRIYRTKLLEFEEATKKFQTWYDEVLEENRKQAKINEDLTAEFAEKEASMRREHAVEMETKILQLESNFEQEKQRKLAQHAEQVKQISEKHTSQNESLQQQYDFRIASLKTEFENFKITNSGLKEKFTLQRKSLPNLHQETKNSELTEMISDKERDELKNQIRELQKKVGELQNENNKLALYHAQEITKLQEKLDSNNENLRRLIKETKVSIDNTKLERVRRIREMQLQIQRKEDAHQIQLQRMATRYGKKIDQLTESVKLLQNQLTEPSIKKVLSLADIV